MLPLQACSPPKQRHRWQCWANNEESGIRDSHLSSNLMTPNQSHLFSLTVKKQLLIIESMVRTQLSSSCLPHLLTMGCYLIPSSLYVETLRVEWTYKARCWFLLHLKRRMHSLTEIIINLTPSFNMFSVSCVYRDPNPDKQDLYFFLVNCCERYEFLPPSCVEIV